MTDCRDVIEHYEYQVQCFEDRIEKLEAANLRQSLIKVDDMRRIEKLEAALRTVKEWHGYGLPTETTRMIDAALEGKDD